MEVDVRMTVCIVDEEYPAKTSCKVARYIQESMAGNAKKISQVISRNSRTRGSNPQP